MKGIVIAQGNGNMPSQFRVFQRKLAGAAANDKAYGLDSAILELKAKVRSDFVKPMPNPIAHSTLTPIIENGVATGGNRLICFDSALKEQMDAEYNMDLKIQSSNWNQYQRHKEGFYRTTIGNVENEVVTYCRRDNIMALVESNKNLVGLLLILRSICAQNKGSVKVDEEFQNLNTLHSAIAYLQKKGYNNTTFGEEVLSRYESAIFSWGKFSFGQSTYGHVLSTYSTPMTFAEYVLLSDADQTPINDTVKERTVGRLMIKNSLNKRLREYLVQTFSVSNNACYPNTISDAVLLLTAFNKGSDASNDNVPKEDVTVSYHETATNTDTDDTTEINDIEYNNTKDISNDVNDTEGINNDVECSTEKGVSCVTFNETEIRKNRNYLC
jgi:hypothetical protein